MVNDSTGYGLPVLPDVMRRGMIVRPHESLINNFQRVF